MIELVLKYVDIETLILMLLIFFLAFCGGFAQDYLTMLKSPSKKSLSISFITVSTLMGTLITFAFSEYIEEKIGVRGLMLCSFISGLLGFQILKNISTISGLFKFLLSVGKLIKDMVKLANDFSDFKKSKATK